MPLHNLITAMNHQKNITAASAHCTIAALSPFWRKHTPPHTHTHMRSVLLRAETAGSIDPDSCTSITCCFLEGIDEGLRRTSSGGSAGCKSCCCGSPDTAEQRPSCNWVGPKTTRSLASREKTINLIHSQLFIYHHLPLCHHSYQTNSLSTSRRLCHCNARRPMSWHKESNNSSNETRKRSPKLRSSETNDKTTLFWRSSADKSCRKKNISVIRQANLEDVPLKNEKPCKFRQIWHITFMLFQSFTCSVAFKCF